jgi:hypothetical protein
LRSAASASRSAAAASSKGQFFGLHFNLGSTQPDYEVKSQPSEQQTSTISFPGIFGIPQAIASVAGAVLGVKPAEQQQQQQQPAAQQAPIPQQPQKQPQKPKQQKPKQPAKQPNAQQQKKQPGKQQQPQKQAPAKPAGKPQPYKPFPAGKQPPPTSLSLIAQGPSLQQQQKQHKVSGPA